MGFDFTSFQQWRINFTKMSVEFESWLNRFLLNRGLDFISRVKPRTPVDTGDLRDHWTLDNPAIIRKGRTLHVWFINPMYYATWVEYGHAKPYKAGATPGGPDWVEGYFMMTVSLDEIQREMPAKFEQDFMKYIKALGVI